MLDPSFHAVCEAAAAEWDVPALAVGVDVAGARETLALGCAEDSRFRVASLTKPFTALLATVLLDLEAPAGTWPADVLVRHLLSHTSGYDCELPVRDLGRFGEGDGALAAAVEALPAVRRYLPVERVWSYANTGFWLVGHLCAVAAAATYEDALAAHVLRRAHLEATDFGSPTLAGTGEGAGDAAYPRARRPSGGLVSTVGDLLRFGRMHQSSLLLVPDRDAVFVGLTNSGSGAKALDEVEDAFFERLLGRPRERPQTRRLPVAARRAHAGVYENGDGRHEVSLARGGLTVSSGQGRYAARPVGERVYEIVAGDRMGERFDFPLAGFGRFGSRLAERVA